MTFATMGPVTRRIEQVLASAQLGGAGLIAIELARMVRDGGAYAGAWVPGPGAASAALDAAKIPWRQYRLRHLEQGGLRQVTALLGFAGRLLPSHVDVLHIHNPTIYGLLSPALRGSVPKTIVQFHIEPSPKEVLWALRRRPSAVVTCAEYIARQVESTLEVVGGGTRVLAIQNAIDIDRFHPAANNRQTAKQLVGASNRPLLLMMANLAPHKGQETALRAVARLKAMGVTADAWFAGEERDPSQNYADRLRRLSFDLGIEGQIRWLGFRSDGPELMRAADVFLLPSTHEGLPLSVLEAQASGAIVLGSTIPGVREVVQDQTTGFVIDAGDSGGYAHRIKQLLDDPSLADAIRAAAVSHVRSRHSWRCYEEQVSTLYSSLCVRPGGGSGS